jgi:hypothetical protein
MRRLVLVGAFITIALGCSSTQPPPPPPPAYPSIDAGDPDGGLRFMMDLTLRERQALCDWSNAAAGGYGKATYCDGGSIVSNHTDQNQCMSEYLGGCWNLLVSDFITCRKKEVVDLCALSVYSAPECKAVKKCLGQREGGAPPPEPDAAATD